MCDGRNPTHSDNELARWKQCFSSWTGCGRTQILRRKGGIKKVRWQTIPSFMAIVSCVFLALAGRISFVATATLPAAANAIRRKPWARDISSSNAKTRAATDGNASSAISGSSPLDPSAPSVSVKGPFMFDWPRRVISDAVRRSYTSTSQIRLIAFQRSGRHRSGSSLSAISCSQSSIAGAGSDTCAVMLTGAAPTGGLSVSLSSNNSAVSVPGSVTVPAGETSAGFTATVSAVSTAQTATLIASAGGISENCTINLDTAGPALTLSTGSVSFGDVALNTTSSHSVTLTSSGTSSLTIDSGSAAGAGFSMSGVSFPLTLNPGQTATLTVTFQPTTTGAATGSIAISDDASPGSATISLSGTGTSTQGGNDYVTAFPLTEKPISEGGNWEVPSQSGDSSLWGDVQTSSGLAFGMSQPATYGDPTALVTGTWGPDQTVQATVRVNSTPSSCCHVVELRLRSTIASGSISGYELTCPVASNPDYGYEVVRWNGANGQYLVIGSGSGTHQCVNGDVLEGTVSGTNPATIDFYNNGVLVATACDNGQGSGGSCGGITYTGPGGAAGPWTSGNPGFGFYDNNDSNWNYFGFSDFEASDNDSAALSVTLAGLSCNQALMTGAGNDSCTVALSGAAPSGGLAVSLSSNDAAVSVPGSVTVPAGATSTAFTATVSAVTTAQSATLTALAGGTVKTYTISLAAGGPALTLGATSVSFGPVDLNSLVTQPVSLTSSGSDPLVISAGSVTGIGFSISGISFPLTLNPGQTATLYLGFDPLTAGILNGSATLTSNASSGSKSTISLSGTGQVTTYAIDLTWGAPASSPDPVAGYNVYRAASGSSSYQLLNNSIDATTLYEDSTVQSGGSYTYYVKSVDGTGNESVPSGTYTVNIP